MADRNLLVRLKLEGADQMAAGHKKVADAVEHQGKATKRLADIDREYQQSRARMRDAVQDANNMRPTVERAAPRFDPRDEAMRRINKADVDRRVQEEMRRLGHGGPAGGGGGGFSGMLPRGLMPLLGMEAGSRAFEGISKGLLESESREFTSMDRTIKDMSKSMLESLPIVGGLTRGILNLADVASGSARRMADAQRQLERSERFHSVEGGLADSRLTTFDRREAVRMAADRADIDSQIARERSASLPGDLGRLLPQAGFGVTAGTGAAARAMRDAEFRVRAAELEVSQSTAAMINGRNPSGMSDAQLRSELKQAREDASRAAQGQEQLRGWEAQGYSINRGQLKQLGADEIDARNKVDRLLAAADADRERVLQKQERVLKAQVDRAKELHQQTLRVADAERDRIGAMRDDLGRAKSLAGSLGMAQPGESDEAARILAAIQAGQAVSPEELSHLRRFAPQSADRAAMLAGQQDRNFGVFQEAERAAMGNLGQGVLGGMENAIAELERSVETMIDASAKRLTDKVKEINAKHVALIEKVMDAKDEDMGQRLQNAAEKSHTEKAIQRIQ